MIVPVRFFLYLHWCFRSDVLVTVGGQRHFFEFILLFFICAKGDCVISKLKNIIGHTVSLCLDKKVI